MSCVHPVPNDAVHRPPGVRRRRISTTATTAPTAATATRILHAAGGRRGETGARLAGLLGDADVAAPHALGDGEQGGGEAGDDNQGQGVVGDQGGEDADGRFTFPVLRGDDPVSGEGGGDGKASAGSVVDADPDEPPAVNRKRRVQAPARKD